MTVLGSTETKGSAPVGWGRSVLSESLAVADTELADADAVSLPEALAVAVVDALSDSVAVSVSFALELVSVTVLVSEAVGIDGSVDVVF